MATPPVAQHPPSMPYNIGTRPKRQTKRPPQVPYVLSHIHLAVSLSFLPPPPYRLKSLPVCVPICFINSKARCFAAFLICFAAACFSSACFILCHENHLLATYSVFLSLKFLFQKHLTLPGLNVIYCIYPIYTLYISYFQVLRRKMP